MARMTLKGMRTTVKERAPNGGGSDIWSPMGDMNVGDTATVRLALYEDALSGGFWTADKRIALEFVSPENDDDTWKFTVPCREMYVKADEGKCPAADIARGLFKEADALKEAGNTVEGEKLEKVALKHWIRYSYLFQGWVLKGGTREMDSNELVPMKFPKSLFSLVQSSVTQESSGFTTLPTGEYDMDDIKSMAKGEVTEGMDEDEFLQLFSGHNYLVRKTTKQNFNNYETGQWEMTQTSLTAEQIENLAENDLIDLTKFLPKQPTPEQYEVMAEMVQVSVDYMLGNGDGVWNTDWEEFGLKPRKPEATDGSSSTTSKSGGAGGSLKDRFKNRKASDSDGDTASLTKSRGAKSKKDDTAPVEEASTPEVEETSNTTVVEENTPDTTDRVAVMKAKLAAKKAKAAA